MSGARLFTIPAGADFAESLARGLIERLGDAPLALSRSIIYLSTRRAARGFGDAFARLLGGSALLPQFRALGDSEDDGFAFDTMVEGLDLPPAIDPIRRQLLLAPLVRRWDRLARGGSLNAAQSMALAESLAGVMDEIERQGVTLEQLEDIAPEHLAEHWQDVAGFLKLIHTEWPNQLAAEQRMNPSARLNAALKLTAERLTAHRDGMVIAAGSTGSIPATARLLETIAKLPNGAVVLPALDRDLDEKSWQELDPGHPQYGLKQLLDRIGGGRAQVADWDGGEQRPDRIFLLREALRPAPTTDAWRAIAETGAGKIAAGLAGLSLIEANDPAEEALAIALALREALEQEGRSAALVTPDRNLARRVAAELTRWNVAIDDSAGRPLAHTSAGVFLLLLAEAAEAAFAPVPLLALLKHPLTGTDPAAFRAMARQLDKYVLRGPRPDAGLAGVSKAVSRAGRQELAAWWSGIAVLLAPLEQCFSKPEIPLVDLIRCHLSVAEQLGDPARLWRGADGEAAALLFNNFHEAATDLEPVEPASYPALLGRLAMQVPVRPEFGRSRAIAILGPLEARLQRFDLTILGGLNEGHWPNPLPADPWFSRPMRKSLGLEQPERRIGLAAHDFAVLASGPDVIFSRSRKQDGAPAIVSRWLQRILQLLTGLEVKQEQLSTRLADSRYLSWARTLSEVAPESRIRRPAPRPPVAARPRRLSVTEIETWLRDPYAIYAKHVLKLRKLDGLDEEVGPLERGTAFHRALELFVTRHPGPLPDDALARLVEIANEVFADIPAAQRAIWRPRFLSAAQWFIENERARRGTIANSHVEVSGRLIFDTSDGAFTLTGKADRIDILVAGEAAILDYKTGSLPEKKWMIDFLTPQLPLEAAMLAAGGFEKLPALTARDLIYLRLSGGARGGEERIFDGAMAEDAKAKLAARIAWFDEVETPYYSRVAPHSAKSEGDYDHLARVREWAPSGWTEEP